MKKRTIRLLRGGLWLLLCAALTLCALSLRSEAPPREDVDAASRMLVSSSELLYGADSTSQIDSSSLSGEAEEPPPPEQPEPPQETPPEQTDAPAEAPPQDVPSDDSGIGDLMDIGSSGGGSGSGQHPEYGDIALAGTAPARHRAVPRSATRIATSRPASSTATWWTTNATPSPSAI